MDALDVVLLILVTLVVLAVLTVVTTRVALTRRNRVVKGVNSAAPVRWQVSPGPEAHLHRRLRTASRRLELLPAVEGTAEIISRLQVEMVELDTHLVTISRRPSSVRRADRRDARDQVAAIEDLVRRLEERERSQAGSLPEIAERLALLEAADDEIRGLEPG